MARARTTDLNSICWRVTLGVSHNHDSLPYSAGTGVGFEG